MGADKKEIDMNNEEIAEYLTKHREWEDRQLVIQRERIEMVRQTSKPEDICSHCGERLSMSCM